MISHEKSYGTNRHPVEEIQDVLAYGRSSLEDPDEAHAFASLQGMRIAGDFTDEDRPITPQSLENLRYWTAFERQLYAGLTAQDKLPARGHGWRDEYFENVQSKLTEKGVDVDIIGTVRSAQELTKEETWEHFLGELSDYHAYLAGDKALPTDEETGEPLKPKDAGHHVNIAEALRVAAWHDMDAEPAQRAQKGQTLEQEVEKIASLLLNADKIGLAINFAKIVSNPQISEPLTDQIVAKLREVREVEGDDNYRQVYNYATQTLNLDQRIRFLQQLPKEATPLIFGSQREMLYAGTTPVLSERFEEGRLAWATLSNGTRIPMPEIDYRERTIINDGLVNESEQYGGQSGVNYDDLPDEAKEAVETAIRVEDEELLRTETLPHYKRLAFWPDEEKGSLLYTVIFRDGANRRMDRYPDHHGFVTSDTERKLDHPVESATAVKDTYMVVSYNGSYMHDATFKDQEPNFFGPGENEANAFWIMGNARTVFSETDARLTRDSHGMPTARFTIVPVRYYQIEEDREAPDPGKL